jgi:hypothetical protein
MVAIESDPNFFLKSLAGTSEFWKVDKDTLEPACQTQLAIGNDKSQITVGRKLSVSLQLIL